MSRLDWEQTQGPTYARAMSERLYAGEDYVLGIDSHTNFAAGWDVILIDMFERTRNPKAILTAYPSGYGEGEDRQDRVAVDTKPARMTSICRTHRVKVGRSTSFKHDMNSVKRPQHGPVRVAFLAAGFNFAAGRRVLDVPYVTLNRPRRASRPPFRLFRRRGRS